MSPPSPLCVNSMIYGMRTIFDMTRKLGICPAITSTYFSMMNEMVRNLRAGRCPRSMTSLNLCSRKAIIWENTMRDFKNHLGMGQTPALLEPGIAARVVPGSVHIQTVAQMC